MNTLPFIFKQVYYTYIRLPRYSFYTSMYSIILYSFKHYQTFLSVLLNQWWINKYHINAGLYKMNSDIKKICVHSFPNNNKENKETENKTKKNYNNKKIHRFLICEHIRVKVILSYRHDFVHFIISKTLFLLHNVRL